MRKRWPQCLYRDAYLALFLRLHALLGFFRRNSDQFIDVALTRPAFDG